jgi:tetratricopeptide (TPR) repeat protein
MRTLLKTLAFSFLLFLAAGYTVGHAQLIAPGEDHVDSQGGVDMLGSQFLLDIEANDQELERFGDTLDIILGAYREREFTEMQQLLNTLFMHDPDARNWELPRLLEAECYYFNGRNDFEFRVFYAKPIYRELMSLFPSSRRNPEKLFRISLIMYQQTFYPETIGQIGYLIEDYPESGIVQKAKLALGKTYLVMENADLAFDEFDSVYKNPDSTENERFVAACGMGVSRMDSGFYTDAARLFSLVIAQPEDMDKLDQKTLFSYGDLQRVLGNVGMAKEAYIRLIEGFPDTNLKPEIWYRLGEITFDENDEENAMALFARTVSDYPETQWAYEARLRIGLMLVAKEPGVWNQQAADFLREVIKNLIFPELSQEAQLALAKMMVDAERFDEALIVLDDNLARPVSDERLLRGLHLFAVAFEKYVQRQFDESNYISICQAYKIYAPFVINDRMKTSVFDRITESFHQSLLFDSLYTIGISRETIRLFPNRAELARARAEAARGHYREAGIVFRELARRDKGFVGLKAALLNVRMEARQDNPVAVIELANKALTLPHEKTDRAELIVLRSQARFDLGDAVTSIEGFRKAVDLLLPADKPRERIILADALYGLASSLYRSGRIDSAGSIIEAATGAFPEDARAGLAKVYLAVISGKPASNVETTPYWDDIAGVMLKSDAWMRASRKRGAWDGT